jgi:hypothetical protein
VSGAAQAAYAGRPQSRRKRPEKSDNSVPENRLGSVVTA